MDLILEARTRMQNLIIDYIEVRLADGREPCLTWKESKISRSPKGFAALYSNVEFDGSSKKVMLEDLKGMKVKQVQTYSQKTGTEYLAGTDLAILSMEFREGEESTAIEAPIYSGDTFELLREHIAIDQDMEVDCDICQQITAYVETWFNVDRKFGLDINDKDGTWLNMYAKYNPFEDTLRIECEISSDRKSRSFDYEPTPSEERLIKDMITEKISEIHGISPKEFCISVT